MRLFQTDNAINEWAAIPSGSLTHELADHSMNHDQFATQQRKSDTGRVAGLHLVARGRPVFPDTASDGEAHDEDAEVLPSFEALIQAVLNGNTKR